MRAPCFRKTPLYHKQDILSIKREKKKRLLISCQISPKENDALVAGQLGSHETPDVAFRSATPTWSSVV